jgi:hypothetical protein
MCNICGLNCGKGGPLKKHIEGAHPGVTYDAYNVCFYGAKDVVADTWNDPATSGGTPVLIHTLVRRFVQDPGPRGVTRTVRHKPR